MEAKKEDTNPAWKRVQIIQSGGSVVKKLPANAKDQGSIPGSGRFPGEENGNRLQYACLESLMDRGTCCATVRGVTKSWAQLSD